MIDFAKDFIQKEGGVFCKGKYEQLHTIPYSAILQAISQVIDDILNSKDKRVSKEWKSELKKVVGIGQGLQILIETFPQLKAFITRRVVIKEVSSAEAKERFMGVICKTLETLATLKSKLVIVLDDLQWCDLDSYNLIAEILKNPNIFLIGAYRSNEVLDGHPLLATIASLKKNFRIKEMELFAPRIEELNKLCSETLHQKEADTSMLSKIIYQKTQGNPLFFVRFFLNLYEEGTLYFSIQEKKFVWDLEAIASKPVVSVCLPPSPSSHLSSTLAQTHAAIARDGARNNRVRERYTEPYFTTGYCRFLDHKA